MIIYLFGEQRSGKDTIADILVQKYGFVKEPITRDIKDVARKYFGMSEDSKDRGKIIEVADGMRAIDRYVWMNSLKRRLDSHADYIHIVIPDVRYKLEAEFLDRLGAVGIRVASPKELRAKREGYDAEFEEHPSETGVISIPFKHFINNSGDLANLEAQVNKVWGDINSPVIQVM